MSAECMQWKELTGRFVYTPISASNMLWLREERAFSVQAYFSNKPEVLVHFFKHVDWYIGNFGSDVILWVFQVLWKIVINQRFEITQQEIITGG